VNLPASRHLDPRWNACLDRLVAAWNELGPDVTLAALSLLSEPQVTPEGLVLVEIAATRRGA
jgi:hypothetical protein